MQALQQPELGRGAVLNTHMAVLPVDVNRPRTSGDSKQNQAVGGFLLHGMQETELFADALVLLEGLRPKNGFLRTDNGQESPVAAFDRYG